MDKIVIVEANDWTGVYKNGELIAEDHEFSLWTLNRLLGLNLDIKTVAEEWDAKVLVRRGRFPKNLDEVVFK